MWDTKIRKNAQVIPRDQYIKLIVEQRIKEKTIREIYDKVWTSKFES
jgi:hypothetical protein